MTKRSARGLMYGLLGLVIVVALAAYVLQDSWRTAPPDDAADGRPEASGEATPSAPPVAPTEPAAPDAPLENIVSPPERSLWALSADTLDAGVKVAVEFEPYGIGPSAFGPSVVVRVITAEPADPDVDMPDMAGRNVVFLVGNSTVEKGGRYVGTAVTRAQEDRLVFVLEDVRPAP